MKTIKFRLRGDYGHFKIPYTNNNPLTYPFITKTALIGMIGAVVGVEREPFKRLFPILSESLKYSVSLNDLLNKESISAYACNFNNNDKPDRPNKSPRAMEFLKNVDVNVYVMLTGDNNEAVSIFNNFIDNIVNETYVYKPTLGIKQCPCIIDNIEIGISDSKNGVFKTKTFIQNIEEIPVNVTIYKESIPTHQNNDWFNDPKLNIEVLFSENGNILTSSGDYYQFKGENIFAV